MLRLSRLSRSPESINLRFVSPGHANPHFIDRARCRDKFHPALDAKLPSFVSPQFAIRAFPNPVLHPPAEFVPIHPLLATARLRPRHPWSDGLPPRPKPRQIADAYLAAQARSGRRNLSLLFHTSKKATSKSSVVRRRLRSKIQNAILLVLARGADAVPRPGRRLHIVSRPLRQHDPLVLPDWTYLVVPTLAVYKMPMPNLVRAVRHALLALSRRSLSLESLWASKRP